MKAATFVELAGEAWAKVCNRFAVRVHRPASPQCVFDPGEGSSSSRRTSCVAIKKPVGLQELDRLCSLSLRLRQLFSVVLRFLVAGGADVFAVFLRLVAVRFRIRVLLHVVGAVVFGVVGLFIIAVVTIAVIVARLVIAGRCFHGAVFAGGRMFFVVVVIVALGVAGFTRGVALATAAVFAPALGAAAAVGAVVTFEQAAETAAVAADATAKSADTAAVEGDRG